MAARWQRPKKGGSSSTTGQPQAAAWRAPQEEDTKEITVRQRKLPTLALPCRTLLMPVTRGFYGASRRIGVRKGNVFWTGLGFESFPYDKIKIKIEAVPSKNRWPNEGGDEQVR